MTNQRECKYKPNFLKVEEEANNLLLSKLVNDFPFTVESIVETMRKLKIQTFEEMARRGIDMFSFGSDDGITISNGENYLIVYNEAIGNEKRKKFTLLHELAHIILAHDMEVEPKSENGRIQEIEANFFAACMLMPTFLLQELVQRGLQLSVKNIALWFDVSQEAANKRLTTLLQKERQSISYEDKVAAEWMVRKFSGFLDSIAPVHNRFSYDFEDEFEDERNRWY